MSQTLYTATQKQTLTFSLCDVANTLHSNSNTNTYLLSLWCLKHFAQQLKHKHLPFVSVMSQTLYTATQTLDTYLFSLWCLKHFAQQLKHKHLPFLSVMSQTLYTTTQTLNTYLFSLWCLIHFTQQLKQCHKTWHQQTSHQHHKYATHVLQVQRTGVPAATCILQMNTTRLTEMNHLSLILFPGSYNGQVMEEQQLQAA